VEEFEVRRNGQPLHGGQRRYGGERTGLKKWQASVAEQAAMFRVVMLVLIEQSRRLRKQHYSEQQDYSESPKADMFYARKLTWNRQSLSFVQFGTE
jgi:hypothetical protein